MVGLVAPVGPNSFVPTAYRVKQKIRESADTLTLAIAPINPLAAIPIEAGLAHTGTSTGQPGQFNMLYAHGVGEIPVSISGTTNGGLTLQTIRAVGPVSRALTRLKVGGQLGVRGPFGTMWPIQALAGRSLIIIAGGIGLAPLRPAIRYAIAHLAAFTSVAIYIGARTPDDLIFARELCKWSLLAPALSIKIAVDSWQNTSATGALLRPSVGMVTALLPGRLPASTTSALVCGPEVMMRHAGLDLMGLGVSADDIFISLERNMKCAIGLCGHCQLSSLFICKDGPVLPLTRVQHLLRTLEL